MSETKFTKGPWSTVPGSLEVFDSDRQSIADVADRWKGTTTDQGSANAQLMAAAPELYEALEAAMLDLGSLVKDERCDHAVGICWCGTYRTLDAAAAALKKARGEQ